MGNLFINDAFGCLHRKHMSICGFLGDKYYGYLIQKEVNSLKLLINNINNEKILSIVGGGKIDDKLKLFEGDSKKLAQYLEDLPVKETDKILFFLDSHGSGYGCPLIEELEAIKGLENNNHVIMIDDVRIIRDCVWSDPAYENYRGGGFEEVLKSKILEINKDYKFSFLNGYQDNDVLVASL